MKVTVNQAPQSTEIKYPCLMIGKQTNIIILFTEYQIGTVIHEGSSLHKIGYTQKNWSMDAFIKFNGQVTLENYG